MEFFEKLASLAAKVRLQSAAIQNGRSDEERFCHALYQYGRWATMSSIRPR